MFVAGEWPSFGRRTPTRCSPRLRMRATASTLGLTATLEARGHDGLEARVARAHQEFVADGGYVFRPSGDAERLRDVVKFRWEMVPAAGGEVAGVGLEILLERGPDRPARRRRPRDHPRGRTGCGPGDRGRGRTRRRAPGARRSRECPRPVRGDAPSTSRARAEAVAPCGCRRAARQSDRVPGAQLPCPAGARRSPAPAARAPRPPPPLGAYPGHPRAVGRHPIRGDLGNGRAFHP
jgi:hypothetical protein